jgi:hypothetical protein
MPRRRGDILWLVAGAVFVFVCVGLIWHWCNEFRICHGFAMSPHGPLAPGYPRGISTASKSQNSTR